MISLSGTPYTFGLGISFHIALPVTNTNGMEGKLWGFSMVVGPLVLQVNYVRVL